MILDNQQLTTDEVEHHLHFSHGSAHGITQNRLWSARWVQKKNSQKGKLQLFDQSAMAW
jgi:hypothetical protein